jgi:hypothetical protein
MPVKCSCGYTIQSNTDNVACPKCGMFYGDVKSLTEPQIELLIQKQWHTMKQGARLSRNLVFIGWVSLCVYFLAYRSNFAALIGGKNWSGTLELLWLAIFVILIPVAHFVSYGVAVMRYQFYTGKAFVDDRAAFGRARGLDIACWSPLLSYLILFGLYWRFPSNSIVNFFRHPWIVLVLWLAGVLVVSMVCCELVYRITTTRGHLKW